jgi:hypothetical protein
LIEEVSKSIHAELDRMAAETRSFVYFKTAAYHRAGKLILAVPTIN